MEQFISYRTRLRAAVKLAARLEQAVAALRNSFPLDPNTCDPVLDYARRQHGMGV